MQYRGQDVIAPNRGVTDPEHAQPCIGFIPPARLPSEMEARVKGLLPLAAKIAREFDNIPGLPHAEIEIVA
jgi:hypothetical protein